MDCCSTNLVAKHYEEVEKNRKLLARHRKKLARKKQYINKTFVINLTNSPRLVKVIKHYNGIEYNTWKKKGIRFFKLDVENFIRMTDFYRDQNLVNDKFNELLERKDLYSKKFGVRFTNNMFQNLNEYAKLQKIKHDLIEKAYGYL